jgi:hypothetical protein
MMVFKPAVIFTVQLDLQLAVVVLFSFEVDLTRMRMRFQTLSLVDKYNIAYPPETPYPLQRNLILFEANCC